MEFILFVAIVVFWRVWTYPFIWVVQFLPSSFFVKDSTPTTTNSPKPRTSYTDSTPDPFADVKPTDKWVANQFMSPEHKSAYLRSAKWASLKREILMRDNFKCRCCNSTSSLEIHHVSYIGLGGNELIADLITLCKKCHQYQHDVYGYDRVTMYYPVVSRFNTSQQNNSVLPEDNKLTPSYLKDLNSLSTLSSS